MGTAEIRSSGNYHSPFLSFPFIIFLLNCNAYFVRAFNFYSSKRIGGSNPRKRLNILLLGF